MTAVIEIGENLAETLTAVACAGVAVVMLWLAWRD